jgi:putative transcriptional regulator
MNIHQHPDLAWLIDYSAGNLSPGFNTVIAGHLGVCGGCRAQLGTAERLGEHLNVASPVLTPRISAAAIRARAPHGTDKGVTTPSAAPSPLHNFVASSIGFDWGSLDWQPGVAGLRIARLQDRDDERIWLLHTAAGVALPEHTHEGAELTLILHGAYRTDDQLYGAGDVDENDESVTHRPIVTNDGDCMSLLVFEGRIKYTGVRGIAQKILKF